MAKSTMLTLPEYNGSRAAASALLSDLLPEDLSDTAVEIDCSQAVLISQGFSDELCKQILELRHALSLTLREPPPRMAIHSVQATVLRGLKGLQIIDRP